ncbi:Com family DNA-binding transcriptional regulator [Salmonella enterica]|nr:Com family DNA-binding transcriptional regulator [Salmonella enterica]EBP4342181.1 Com family DNA-binding transcriptional regulator [Salmonella enterica]ELW2864711.1 Com family DNA-binding transcriptional regulator [Salmonella enterica]
MENQQTEKQLRCGQCQRLLAVAAQFSSLHIKCPRCKTLNHFTHSQRAV